MPVSRQHGFSLIEVLVTILILAAGLLGIAGLQARTSTTEMESLQRSQALLLVQDMAARLEQRAVTSGPTYIGTVGTGDTQPADCSALALGAPRDLCEWSNALKGAAEKQSSRSVGAMVSAVGCVSQTQAPDPTLGVCRPGIYQVEVAWQGLLPTASPASTCGADSIGRTPTRRVVSLRVVAPTLGCS